ncbi:methyltransferase domain-containing protein [Halobacteria archaeon AArc-curdl1]|uniref:Methyltransferase domain-containing protein n=1 Tax=Natronosalvus hydrolyticus TaxID=2979988 RepID=A0AAP3E7G5_9EURY|nr:methyltransferase domain-containing protein [Halobacteria archaeon AArc-curdl1]
MKRSVEEHAARFDEQAADYDDAGSPEYRACANLVIEYANPNESDTVLDLGTGTGAIALALAEDAECVVGRDISDEMMHVARTKAEERGVENVTFGYGTFREPNWPGGAHGGESASENESEEVDIVTSNFAMHHLDDAAKREAIETIGALEPRRFVLGDLLFFDEADSSASFYDPAVDDPATVGVLADALTDAGFSLTAVERVHDLVGVLVAERPRGDEA